MENRRGNEIFLGVVGVATLVVAIIGATFAYFSASVRGENHVNVESAKLELGFAEDTEKLTTLLIPTDAKYAQFAGTDALWIAESTEVIVGYEEDGTAIKGTGQGLCYDDNKNKICGVYDFTVMNPNTTTMSVTAEVITTVNTFEAGNMKFAIYEKTEDENGTAVYTKIVNADDEDNAGDYTFASLTEDGTEPVTTIDEFDFRLTAAKTAVTGENKDKVASYTTDVAQTEYAADGETVIGKTVRNFRMVIYLKETKTDQTEKNSGKMLTAAIRIKTIAKDGEVGSGVTGVIAAANAEAPTGE